MSSLRDVLLDLPALAPPANVTPNFENPPSNPGMALGFVVPCLVITSLITFLRLYVKTFIVGKWHLEDWLLPVAYLFSVAQYTATIHAYTYAPVVHQYDMTLRTVSKFLLDFHIGAIFYDVTILTLKICILSQFARIFVPAGERNKTYWATQVLIWMNTIFYTVTTLVEIFACRPIRKAWDPLITGGKCVNTPAAYLTSQTFNCALDLLILVWTQVIIWKLHMSTKQKLKLGVLFVAGFLACIFAACSIWINVEMFDSPDQAYWGAWMALFTFPETTSGFLVLCLPVVPKFVKHTQAKLFPSTLKSNTAPSNRGRTLEEGRPGARRSGGRPRSWWHISAASSKLSSIGSKWTGTTITRNDTIRNSKILGPMHEEDKTDLGFITFGPPELNLRFDYEDQVHMRPETDIQEHEMMPNHQYGDDRIYSGHYEGDVDEYIKRPKQQHSPV